MTDEEFSMFHEMDSEYYNKVLDIEGIIEELENNNQEYISKLINDLEQNKILY